MYLTLHRKWPGLQFDTSRRQVLGQTNMEGCKIIIIEVIYDLAGSLFQGSDHKLQALRHQTIKCKSKPFLHLKSNFTYLFCLCQKVTTNCSFWAIKLLNLKPNHSLNSKTEFKFFTTVSFSSTQYTARYMFLHTFIQRFKPYVSIYPQGHTSKFLIFILVKTIFFIKHIEYTYVL